ncbi:MAG: single-stranded-DNA-specific exonuclease RecJ [Haliscomenobacteraceae bacterium CHB4]|nr:Single-stranded-DNA-specific exonuclease RecJ [Saprospiraceae bacterium]MCE7922576.1 single-stranded-DNA-specific exonuclease RecJ [Haliscomenobacteraceae bacterium CHB4]
MKSPRWQLIPTDEAAVQALRRVLGIDPLFCRLLVQRGVTTFDEARAFFRPSLDDLHNPFLMKDMDAAVARLDDALRRKERILLYGDYDVDGTTSVALMYAFLSGFYRNLDYYLPDREKEGYGVSLASVEYARETGATLVIAMDCGIKAQEAIARAKGYGIDYIVCDHHLPEGELPGAVANLDPKRADCPYPFKELSGCGIAFKLAQALAMQHNTPPEELDDLLDLVAVSTACDIVPMTGENRILARFGLHRLNHAPRTGLWALMQRINRPFPLDVADLVFGLGPLINAAGRLGDAREAVRLMLSADRNSALDYAGALVRRNKERREVDYAMADEARRRFTGTPGWEARKSIVLFDPNWHKGIIGIAASRMTEAFHKPSVILTKSNDRAVGSARSVPGFDLYAALRDCEDLFFSYGGHAHAAGMQMPVDNVEAFAERFENIANQHITPENEHPVLDICAGIRLDDITPKFWQMLRQFEPFGPHNRNPVFWAEGVVDTGHSRRLDNNHVRLSLRHTNSAMAFKGIGFGLADVFEKVKDRPFDVAFNLKAEQWRGEAKLSLHVKDFRRSEG